MKKNSKRLLRIFILVILTFSILPTSAASNWYQHTPYVMHAMGTVQNKIYTNSKEAFVSSYKKRARTMEVDLTSDKKGKVVCGHTLTSYLSFKKKYTTLSIKQLVALAKQYKNVNFVIDIKTHHKSYNYIISQLNKEIQKTKQPRIYQQMIIQVCSTSNYYYVKRLKNFSQYIFTLYKIKNINYGSIRTFCQKNKIPVVTISYSRIRNNPSIVNLFHKAGIKVYTHTIDKQSQVKKIRRYGIDGYYINKIGI